MPALIVDDTPILGDKGDVFDVDDDFDAPDGTRYVSDIHNVAAKPQKRANKVQRAAAPGPPAGGAAGYSTYNNAPPAQYDDERGPPLLHESPPRSAYKAQGGYGYQSVQRSLYGSGRPVFREPMTYRGPAHWGPVHGSMRDMPHPHQISIARQLGSGGYGGYGGYGRGYHEGGYGYAAPAAPYHGTVNYEMPAAPTYGPAPTYREYAAPAPAYHYGPPAYAAPGYPAAAPAYAAPPMYGPGFGGRPRSAGAGYYGGY